MHKYYHIKENNTIYIEFVNYYCVADFKNLMLSTLIYKDDSSIGNIIDYVKRLRHDCGTVSLRKCKHFADILNDVWSR